MSFRRFLLGAIFCCFYLLFYLTNKYVLSVLKFTYPTLFQGDVQMLSGEDRPDSFTVEVEELQYFDKKWQTLVGGLLLALSGKLGWVEVHSISRSAALSWLPGSVLFVGNIYAGSRALSRLPIPIFFTLYNASEVVTCFIQKLTQREATSWMKLLSVMLLLTSAGCLPLYDPQFDPSGYFWAVIHFLCVGGYKVFKCSKSSLLSDLEQQYINYVFSVLLLAFSAHPTGDLFGALEFPYLHSYKFHSGCCASGVLGFFVLLATVRLKSNLPVEHCAAWVFLAKVLAAVLSLFVFDIVVNIPTVCCLLLSCFGEALLVYSK